MHCRIQLLSGDVILTSLPGPMSIIVLMTADPAGEAWPVPIPGEER